MHPYAALTALAFAATATAKQCTNLTIPVQVMARQGIFAVPDVTTNEEVTAFFQNYTSIAGGTNYTAEVLLGYQNIEGAFDISAMFCTPDAGLGAKPVVQVLTHGIGFDKTYWDLPYNNYMYSYIDVATSFGFCTLSIDRLGIGNSSHADPYNVVQAPAEIGALYSIGTMLREGTLPGVAHAFSAPNSIVNVGHSFGSQQSYMLSLMYPNITDAIVLTGFSFNSSYTPTTVASFDSKIAAQNQPLRFGSTSAAAAINAITTSAAGANITLSEVYQLLNTLGISTAEATDILRTTELWDFIAGSTVMPYPIPQNLPPGYLTWADAGANQFNFFYPSGYDPEILFFAESNKQPYTFGEILTLGGAPVVSPFTGPVQILTGQQDAIYCGGDCYNTGVPGLASIPAAAAPYFPASRDFNVFIQPDAGHAINAHYVAPAAYAEIQNWLVGNGVVPS